MKNPWEEISLSDYENHMSLASVRQLQTMNEFMKEQFEGYPVRTAMVLGAAGGNGFEHIRPEKYDTVYGVDINREYLQAVNERCKGLGGVLRGLRLDLLTEADRLPQAELVIANLLVEYIGCAVFQDVIRRVDPAYVSCVIQINTGEGAWVSDSPYLHVFDRLEEVHCEMNEEMLTKAMTEIGYGGLTADLRDLPNGKALLRLDYGKPPRKQ